MIRVRNTLPSLQRHSAHNFQLSWSAFIQIDKAECYQQIDHDVQGEDKNYYHNCITMSRLGLGDIFPP